ncbi:MAG: biotin/lipoyl-containing protein, partial [Chitinophagaceae bacterium]
MNTVSIILPKMGEAIHEATLIKWIKKKGDIVVKDESIAEIATDKIDNDIVATESGVIEEIFFKENDIIPVGAIICTILQTSIQGINSTPEVEKKNLKKEFVSNSIVEKKHIQKANPTIQKLKNSFFSPLLKKIIEKEKISQEELSQIKGSGQKNRITKEDICAYLDKRDNIQKVAEEDIKIDSNILSATETVVDIKKEESSVVESDIVEKIESSIYITKNPEIIEMDRMRKIIAKHMIDSQKTSAHVTSFAEVDVTNIVEWRNKYKNKI